MQFTSVTAYWMMLAMALSGCTPAGIAGIPCPGTPATTSSAPTTLRQTGRVFDLAIKGDGYFVIRDWQSKRNVYTRYGHFRQSPEGNLITLDGRQVIEPQLSIPTDAVLATFTADGFLQVRQPCTPAPGSDGCGKLETVGQIQLARFTNPGALEAVSPTIFAETCTSGPPILQPPNQNGAGALVTGALEVAADAHSSNESAQPR